MRTISLHEDRNARGADTHWVVVNKHSRPCPSVLAALKRHSQWCCLVIGEIQMQLADLEKHHET